MKYQVPIKKPVRGLGDVVHAVAKWTGAEAVVKTAERVTGKSCGCEERRQKLNRLMPFKRDPK